MPMPPERRKPVAGKAMGSPEIGKVGNLSNPEHSSNIDPVQVPSAPRQCLHGACRVRSSLVQQSLGYVAALAAVGFILFVIAGLLS